MKFLRRILLLALAAIALTLATHAAAIPPPPAGPARAYPTEFPLSEPDYTSKRLRDFSPFESALANFSAARRSALDALVLEATISQLQQRMASGDLTAEELVVYYLDRIQRYDVNQLNSVMELNPEALTIARNLDAERAEGNLWGPLHGIPVLVKDNITTGDQMHTTAGAYVLKDWRGDRDAQLVKNLRNAGAVILGKANPSEWANYVDPAMPSGFSALGGQTRHPYGPFDPLGSSSGSAVSVAANLTAVSVGSETAGSIVRPAATNNIVGLKPTHGLVSSDYVIPLVDWVDVPGPMGRTVTDVATLLSALTHTDEGSEENIAPAVAELQSEDFTRFLNLERAKQQRVGVAVISERAIANLEALLASPPEDLPAETRAALPNVINLLKANNQAAKAAIAALTQQGIAVVELDSETVPPAPDANAALPPGFKASLNAFLPTLPNSPTLTIKALIDVVSFNYADPANRIPYGQDHLSTAQRSDSPSAAYTTLRDSQQTTARAALDQFFAEAGIDVLIASTQAYAAAGYPALTVPIGVAETGELLGAYLIGKALSEPDLLAVGYAIEQVTQARQPPDLEKTLATFANLHHAVASTQ
ncbi:amidase family protein [Thermoleptolyngbya sichuanensis XZ-Cy5]|uniref:amidase family protein n=1 Tax=Thermoleptolyngbya sichuanensis TaxID=2885951 RepID=UPI00240DEFB8|nr:amidase family protein [Thermoleptolyngbya sichuanensis]MDG2617392.1 amidase family protein [Thermoleptolyngbya sichuanensis XZ-Cy5]